MKPLKIFITLFILYSVGLFADNNNQIDYASVSAKLEKLKKSSSAKINKKNSWSIISVNNKGKPETWFFSPEEKSIHHAMIKKTVSKKGKGLETKIVTHCKASKPKCDDLIKQFNTINDAYQ